MTATGDRTRRLTPGLEDVLAAAALGVTVWLLYGSIVWLWWTFDDLFHVHLLRTHAPFEILFSRSFWQALPFRMFTPLQLLSYDVDLALFGVRPKAFYVHQLLSLAIAAVAVYGTVRRWLSPALAWAAASLFLLGAPLASWGAELMLRHYVEGLIGAALAVWLFVEGLRRERSVALVGSALFYFLAMLDKEVYVPLLALLLILPEGTLRVRLRALRPHALVLLVYVGWRWTMLGTPLGGYGWVVGPREWPGLLVRLPFQVTSILFDNFQTSDIVLLACLVAGIALLIVKRPRSAGVLAASAILVLAPIVPLARSINERFGTLPWLLVSLAFVFGCREFAKGAARERVALFALLLLAGSAALVSNRGQWHRRHAEAERMSAEGRFFLSLRPGDLLRHPRTPAAAMSEARWLKEEYLGLPRGGGGTPTTFSSAAAQRRCTGSGSTRSRRNSCGT